MGFQETFRTDLKLLNVQERQGQALPQASLKEELPQDSSSAHSTGSNQLHPIQTKSQILSSPAPSKSGETAVWQAGVTPCKNSLLFPTTKPFVCLFFSCSKDSLMFCAGCTIHHAVQEIMELELICIPPHPTGPHLGCAKFNITLGCLLSDVDSGPLCWIYPSTAFPFLNREDKIKMNTANKRAKRLQILSLLHQLVLDTEE